MANVWNKDAVTAWISTNENANKIKLLLISSVYQLLQVKSLFVIHKAICTMHLEEQLTLLRVC